MPATDLREHLVSALAVDLVGPYDEREELRLPPSRWYLTGFLVPKEARDEPEVQDPTDDEEAAAGNDETEEETAGAEPEPKQKNRLPASMGLSVLLPAGPPTDEVTVTLRFAEYVLEEREDGNAKRGRRKLWVRAPREPVVQPVPLDRERIARGIRLVQYPGIVLKGKLAEAEVSGLPRGTRALSLFVVNERPIGEKGRYDERFLFQVELELSFGRGIVPRPNQRDADASDWDDRVLDLQFRDRCEYAVGHGVSVVVPPGQAPVTTVRTTWIPRAEVRRVVTHEDVPAEVGMEALADLDGADATRRALRPIGRCLRRLDRAAGAVGARPAPFDDTRSVAGARRARAQAHRRGDRAAGQRRRRDDRLPDREPRHGHPGATALAR